MQATRRPPLQASIEGGAGVTGGVVQNHHRRLANRFAKIIHDLNDRLGGDVVLVEISMYLASLRFKTNGLNVRSVRAGDRNIGSFANGKPTVRDHAFEGKAGFVEVHNTQLGFGKHFSELFPCGRECLFIPLFTQAATKSFPAQPESPRVSPQGVSTDRLACLFGQFRKHSCRIRGVLPQQFTLSRLVLFVEFSWSAWFVFFQESLYAGIIETGVSGPHRVTIDPKNVNDLLDAVVVVAE